jgi:pyrimidine-nucleoside phosphorylase
MRAVDIIINKRDGKELSREEIEFFIEGYVNGEIPDYQAAAWAMAVLLNGMNERETTDLTLAMVRTGEILDLSDVVSVAVDKHSTGGVGDKTTIVVEPVVAACGLPVGKMSGRGLGFSGGTLDKMESIPGYRTDLTTKEFLSQLGDLGLVLTGQTCDMTPADGMLYSLRDVTGTVQSIPLIASSIMSKKIASGAQAIVLDVKVGVGAFMQDIDDARELSELMVSIARLAGSKAVALLADMNQPLGQAVGNAIELKEAIHTLQGDGPADFVEHCLVVASYMLHMGGMAESQDIGYQMASEAIANGRGWEKFVDLVKAQGGDTRYIETVSKLPKAKIIQTVSAPWSGYISEINARIIGETCVLIGAGREKKSDEIDHSVGVEIFNNVGDYVEKGQDLFTVHANRLRDFQIATEKFLSAYHYWEGPVDPLPLFYGVVE